ncbi:hypothetical protein TEHSL10_03940 [Tetragenococcus halophilus]|nr:hypothetical protein TEHD23766T_2166 [Tetragenococcus halophilus subsp. flandriensis]GMQ72762.1 hypothetical protein TEHSL10_03940 [Tetragenococcus halophilus]
MVKDLTLTKVTKNSAANIETTTPQNPIVGNKAKLAIILIIAPKITDLLLNIAFQ